MKIPVIALLSMCAAGFAAAQGPAPMDGVAALAPGQQRRADLREAVQAQRMGGLPPGDGRRLTPLQRAELRDQIRQHGVSPHTGRQP